MTMRLVALMSVVLLLSLAAFGLLMAHYQDEVMLEVANTASAVGKATLRTLEYEGDLGLPPGLDVPEDARMLVTGEFDLTEDRHLVEDGHVEHRQLERVVVVHSDEVTSGDPERGTRVIRRWVGGERTSGPDDCEIVEWVSENGQDLDHVNRFYIDTETVRVESDPAMENLVLKIPRFTAAREGGTIEVSLAKHDELQLPIPVEDYRELFASIRSRSLFLFLGVFLVGTALSTGLASRFTRPIRRLDAGIHQLSEGDLDVQVDARGKGEIARLARGFNEMANKLRASRDRSREMVRREKLSALGGLAAGVAHDVRNPLHSIGLTLQHMREACRPEDTKLAAEFDRSLGVIRGEIGRLDKLVGNFLRFAKSDPRERQPVDLADVLRETARLVRKEAEWRKIEVELDIIEALPSISAEGESIRSSILNLVLNSFDAMPEGGRLSLGLRVEGDSLVVEVADTGRGIPAEDQDRVFEFAYTTREGGNGLGLAMVHHVIVEEHGGRVSLDSAPGQGTRVRLALPIRSVERGESA